MYEVRMTKHHSGKTYNVDLISWQRGEGMAVGKAFNVSRKEADKEADRVAKLYNAQKVLMIVPGE